MYDDEESEWDKMYEKMRNEKAAIHRASKRFIAEPQQYIVTE